MIHPHHNAKHLEKMKRVGIVSDYKHEYNFDSDFAREVKREVYKIVKPGRDFGTPGFLLRAAFYSCLMAYLQWRWVVFGSSVRMAVLLGMSMASIGLNVQHDANHGAASRKSWVNDLLGFGADFIGGSKILWMEQHWTHHAYTNNNDKDPDSFSAEPMMLFHDYPKDSRSRKFHHKFQALFFLPVLSFYWLSVVFNPQIFDLKHRGVMEIGIRFESDYVKNRKLLSVAIRLVYIYWNCITPFFYHDSITALYHIWLLGVAESMCLATLFALSHNFENSDRDPTAIFKEKGEAVCWYKSQVETSSTYGGLISGALTGGLNFQVEHHLFPRMSSAWYPYIAPTVRKVCEKHGVNYAYYPWLWQNFISTVKYMHSTGSGDYNHLYDCLNPLSGKA